MLSNGKKILILGRSGTGKSTAIRTLEPTETFIIKCTEKRITIQELKQAVQQRK